MNGNYITAVEELKEIYDAPSEMVMNKQIDYLDENCRAFLAASPFFLLATFGASGADCSPRGDEPGFVEIGEGGKTLLIPDRAGNNRIDSLRNIVENPAVGLLFLVPGITYTLRVNGTAKLSVEPGLIEQFAVKGKAPRSVIVVSVEEAFTQCARALLRADIWNPEKLAGKDAVPSMGAMLAAHTKGGIEADPMCKFQSVTSSAKRSDEASPTSCWQKYTATVWLTILRMKRLVRCQRSLAHTFLAL